ncbi:MAG: TonB-dependent receptor [Candidatus Tectomicrobia bacterium]|nr:TonB-dependent receptor [Candidatus Tectomicrobia bacterium]
MKTLKAAVVAAGAVCALFVLDIAPALSAEISAEIEEIIVTARQREENIQDVPIAVTNISGALIETAHAESLIDVEKLLPNVELAFLQTGGRGLTASIRGVGYDDNRKTFEPTVGVSLDGVFLGSNSGAAALLFDIESVQVLRGPQGTLFGRNTTGGTMVVTRTRPTGELGGSASFTYGRYNSLEEKVVLNLPKIGDVLSTKLYVFKKDGDSFIKQAGTGKRFDLDDALYAGGAFLFEPSDEFEALLSIDYLNDKQNPYNAVNLTPAGLGYVWCDVLTRIIFANTPFSENGCRSTSFEPAEESGFAITQEEFTNENFLEGWSVTLEMNWDVSENITLTSITGYRDHDEHGSGTVEGPPGIPVGPGGALRPISEFGQDWVFEQFSQELRMTGSWDRLDLVVGGLYFYSKFDFFPGNLPAHGFVGTQSVLGGLSRQQFSAQSTDAYAAFFDGTYHVTDRFGLSAGLRITHEKKTFSNALEVGFRPPATGPFDVTGSESWTEPSWRVALDYDLTDEVMAYVSWARGFRSGGFNARALSEIQTLNAYDPEVVDTYELGARIELMDGRVRLNPTVFYMSYRDKQEVVILSAGGGLTTSIVFNASELEYFGAEFELDARITDGLTLRASLGYLDSKVEEFLIEDLSAPVPTFIDDSENRQVRRAPEVNLSVGLDYTVPVSNSGELTLFGLYSWRDGQFTDGVKDNLPQFDLDEIDSYGSADFSITYTHKMGNANRSFSVSAFIEDAFADDRGRVIDKRNAIGALAFGFLAQTKRWGIEAKIDF